MMKSAPLRWLLSLALLLVSACPSTHPAQISDTATSWLRACVTSEECGEYGHCIEQICTLACAGGQSSECRALGPSATCNNRTGQASGSCDIACTTHGDCAALGSGYTCLDAGCRAPGLLRESIGALSFSAAENPGIEPAPALILSLCATPVGDHFRIYYESVPVTGSSNGAMESVSLTEIDLFNDGTTRRANSASTLLAMASSGPLSTWAQLSPHGGIAIVAQPPLPSFKPDNQTCWINFIRADALEKNATQDVACETTAQVAGVADRDEWIVLLQGDDLSLGRFSTAASGWSLAPIALTELKTVADGRPNIQLSVVGHDVLLLLSGDERPAVLARVPNAVTTQEAFESIQTENLDASASGGGQTGGYFTWDGLSERWLTPTWWYPDPLDGNNPRPGDAPAITSYPLDESDRLGNPVQFMLKDGDQQPGRTIAGAPERGLVAILYADVDEMNQNNLFFTLFDKNGKRLVGPITVASNAGPRNTLNWSGSAFLVTWEETDNLGSTVHARIFELP